MAVLETVPRFIDLINAGVVIVTLMDRQEYSKERLTADWTPLILSIAVMARAHEESATKPKRLREAWDKKRATVAEKVLTSRVPFWLQVIDGRIEPIPHRAEIVRRIFTETIDGDGRRTIVRRLNSEGVPSFMARKTGWQPSYVAKVLSNRAVIGEFQAYLRDEAGRKRAQGEPLNGYFPQVVSEFDFLKASAASRSRKTAAGRRGEHVTNLFTGLAKCTCGASMVIEDKGKPPKGGRYLVCADARRSVGCGNHRLWRVDRVEAAMLQALRRVDLPAGPKQASGADDAVAVLEDRLANALKRWERLLDLVEEGDEGAAARAKALTKAIADLRSEILAAKADLTLAAATPTYAEQIAELGTFRDRLGSAVGDELTQLRTRLAQTLRTVMIRIDFTSTTIVCRMRVEQIRYRVGISQGGTFPDGAPVTILDETPRILSEDDNAGYAQEAIEDKARGDAELFGFMCHMAASER